MKKYFYPLAMAALLAMPAVGYAQDEGSTETDPDLTISFNVTDPKPGAFKDVPHSFTLDFSASSINVTSIKDNTDYTVETVDGADPMYTGKYAYVVYINADGTETLQSAPLKSVVNADKTLTLNLSTAETPLFEAALKSEGYYTLNLVVPYGLYTVSGTNITGKEATYLSLSRNTTFLHTGDSKIVTFTTDPATETEVEKIGTINVSFDLSNTEGLTWVNTVNLKPTVYVKATGTTQWVANGNATCRVDASNPATASIRVLPAQTAQGQYRVDIPFGAWTLKSFKDAEKTEVADSYISQAQTLYFAVGEEVQLGGLKKDEIFAFAQPAEGPVNLTQIPSGVEYLMVTFQQIPELNRTSDETIKLYYNGGTTPLKEVSISDQNYVRLQTKGIANEYGHVVNIWFDQGESDIVAPGDYTVVFPAGIFLFGDLGEPNAQFTLNYHIDKVINYTLYPNIEYATLPEIENIYINFNNATEVVVNPDNDTDITLETVSGLIRRPTSVEINGKVAKISFDKITSDNYYTLKVPSAYFLATIDDEILPNQVIEGIYNVFDQPRPTIVPAEGILNGNSLYEITLQVPLPDDQEITAVLETSYNRLLGVTEFGEIEYGNRISYFKTQDRENSIGSDYVTLVPTGGTPLTLAPGNYVLITAKYLYTVTGGETADEYFYFFTVLPDGEVLPKPTVTPEEMVVNGDLFTLTFPETTSITALATNTLAYLYPKNEDGTIGEAIASYIVTKGASSNEVDLVKVTSGDIPGGVYSLQTQKGQMKSKNSASDAYDFTIWFGMVGAEATAVEATDFNVYTLEGICIIKNADAAALSALPKGFYIINGKKIVIR